MRWLIFLFTLFSLNIISAQTWSFKTGGNAFDGQYKTANVKGNATDYPYYDPLLVINLFNEESLNFYISGAGYYGSTSDIEVLWVFNNEPKTIYSSENLTTSDNGKIIFFSGFRNNITNEYLDELEFIDKLKIAGKVDVRVKNSYGQNDIVFNLYGSTKAIDYVISKKYKEKQKAAYEKYKKEFLERIDRQVEVNLKILTLLEKNGILKEDQDQVLKKIDDYFDLYNLDMNEIHNINLDVQKHYADLYIYDKNEDLLKEITYIHDYMPNTFDKMKKDILAKEQEIKDIKVKEREVSLQKLSKLLDKFGFSDMEKRLVVDEINYHKSDLESIDSIRISSSRYSSSKDSGTIYLMNKNGEIVNEFRITVPEHILDKIKKGKSIKIDELIKRYGLTEEEKSPIIEQALVVINVYFNRNIEVIDIINIKLVYYNIILEIINKDGSIKEQNVILSNDLLRSISKKIKKFQK